MFILSAGLAAGIIANPGKSRPEAPHPARPAFAIKSTRSDDFDRDGVSPVAESPGIC
jgi:hypothetical protein